jgi:hypothetical protein
VQTSAVFVASTISRIAYWEAGMVLFAFFVLVLGLALNAILLFLVWARLGDIAWSLADLVKMFEKAQTAQGMLVDRLRASFEGPLSQVRPKL